MYACDNKQLGCIRFGTLTQMYKQIKNLNGTVNNFCIFLIKEGTICIPFDPDNTDYARFKKEINEGTADLQDADGNPMTSDAAKAFVATLP